MNQLPEYLSCGILTPQKWNIVAMLGVMKAGGAFVPLDPTHPTSRLQALIQSVQAPVVLSSHHLADKLRPIVKTVIPLCADTLDPLSDPAENVNLASGVTSQNAAYVLFTSGSTGEPKVSLLLKLKKIYVYFFLQELTLVFAGNPVGAPRVPVWGNGAWTRFADLSRVAMPPIRRPHLRCQFG